MKLLDGTPEEIAKFLELTEGCAKSLDLFATIDDFESIHLPGKPTKGPKLSLSQKDETRLPSEGRSSSQEPHTKPQTILPTRPPSKERTAKLEAIFRDYIRAGLNAKAIQEHLIKEHDISMSGHQICGWMGRMRQKGCQMPKDAAKAGLEGNCSSQEESAKEEPTWIPACPGEEVTTQGSKSEDGSSPSKELTLSQIKEIKRLYNKEHLRTIQIAEKMHVPVEQVEAIVWQVKG